MPAVRFRSIPVDESLKATAVTAREVLDGNGTLIGWLYGVNPVRRGGRPDTPSAFRYVPRNGSQATTFDHLKDAREAIEAALPTTDVPEAPKPARREGWPCQACGQYLAAPSDRGTIADAVDAHAVAEHDDHVCVVMGENHGMLCPGTRCPRCHGAKTVEVAVASLAPGEATTSASVECPACSGSGTLT